MAMAAGRQTVVNAVHIIMYPSPANLLESREVLRVCQSFGEVTTFKHLKYHALKSAPNSALAIFQRPESAAAFIKASPVTFTLETQSAIYESADSQGGRDEFPKDIAQDTPSRMDATELHAPNSLLDSTSSTLLRESSAKDALHQKHEYTSSLKDIRMMAEHWRGNHQDFIERSPTWGPFRINTGSATQQDLAKRVPLIGLSDIDVKKAEVPIRILRRRQEELKKRKDWTRIWEEGKTQGGADAAVKEPGKHSVNELGGGDALPGLENTLGTKRRT